MIAQDDVRAALFQPGNDIVGKLILENAVAEAQQFIDIAHCLQSQVEALKVAMKIRNDPNFQRRGLTA
jgi:hypothetical protein